MRRILFTSVLFFSLVPIYAQNSLRIAHVNLPEIYALLPEVDSINELLDIEQKELEIILVGMEEEFLQLRDSLEIEYRNAPEQIKKPKITRLNDLEIRIQEFTAEAQKTIRIRNNELAIPLYNRVNLAVEKVSQQEGIQYVFDVSRNQLIFIAEDALSIDELVKLELGLQ